MFMGSGTKNCEGVYTKIRENEKQAKQRRKKAPLGKVFT